MNNKTMVKITLLVNSHKEDVYLILPTEGRNVILQSLVHELEQTIQPESGGTELKYGAGTGSHYDRFWSRNIC